jgi:hypothetical protein
MRSGLSLRGKPRSEWWFDWTTVSGYFQQRRLTGSGHPTLLLWNDSGHLGVRAPVGAETAEFVSEQYRLMPRFGARTLLLDGEAAATERADGRRNLLADRLVARRRSLHPGNARTEYRSRDAKRPCGRPRHVQRRQTRVRAGPS